MFARYYRYVPIERVGSAPIITADTDASIGTNIQGPSLIAAPPWIEKPLGRYYLYFADHKGGHIRLAYADDIAGPWAVHQPGTLQLADSCFLTEPPPSTSAELAELRDLYQTHFGAGYSIEQVMVDATTPHIASPDVHVDVTHQRVRMYFHGLDRLGVQSTRVALSNDGIHFAARPEVLGPSYFRVFEYDGWFYALVMPGQIWRSKDGLSGFGRGPQLFEPTMRHSAVLRCGDQLHVWWTRVGDAPESILHSTIDLTGDWMSWSNSEAVAALAPERAYEGSDLPELSSQRGAVNHAVNQLRDPAVFVEDDRTFLLYAGAGESNICLAELR